VTEPVAARQVDFIRLDHSISNLYPEGWGHLYGVTRNAVQYTDEVARGRVQADLDHVATGALIIYVFALLEDVFPKPDWSSDLMNPARLERMLAYRHLRNTAAHSMDGSRATQNQDEVRCLRGSHEWWIPDQRNCVMGRQQHSNEPGRCHGMPWSGAGRGRRCHLHRPQPGQPTAFLGVTSLSTA
jgi:hypothetical protein